MAYQEKILQQEKTQRYVQKSKEPVKQRDVRQVKNKMLFDRRQIGVEEKKQQEKDTNRDFYGYLGDDDDDLLPYGGIY